MADFGFRPPARLDINDPRLAHAFTKWKKELNVYLLASGASDKSAEVQCAVILHAHAAGPDFIQKEEQFQYAIDDDKKIPVKLLEKLEEYCNKNLNQVVEAFRFWNTKLCEPFDAFLSELTNQAAACGFGLQKERMIRDKIVFSVEQHSTFCYVNQTLR